MIIIALDRYQVVVNPLTARLSTRLPKHIMVIIIWVLAGVLSIPHAVFNRSVPLYTYRTIYRCRTVYPEPQLFYRQLLTIVTFVTQYMAPLVITIVTYVVISLKIFRKVTIGEVTIQQHNTRMDNKRTTIKMLILVVVVFGVCWLPINVYHIVNDFSSQTSAPVGINTYLTCHWLAFSSMCWNPFIYFGLNPHYRREMRRLFTYKSWSSGRSRNNHHDSNNNRGINDGHNNSQQQYTRSSTIMLSRLNSKTSSERKFAISLTFTHNIFRNVKSLGTCYGNPDNDSKNN
ncbi:unnamed protein product, partial [Medioppia subpectinata]